MTVGSCPLCGSVGSVGDRQIQPLGFACQRCGNFGLDLRFAAGLPRIVEEPEFAALRPYLCAHVRQSSNAGSPLVVTHDNWRDFAIGHAHTAVSRKLDMALALYCQRSTSPGQPVQLSPDDFVLMDAADVQEMNYLRDALTEQGLLSRHILSVDSRVVTPLGWGKLEPLHPGGVPGTCFIAMAFDASLDGVYEKAIKPAVNASGLTEVRVDKVQHNGIVTDLIQAEIRRAQILVADVTMQRPGVYFEAGLALGLGRTVVWSCRNDDLAHVHFDTRQYNHVVWDDIPGFRAALEARLRATIPVGR